MSADEIKEAIREAVQEGIKNAYPKEWLSREDVMAEFNIGSTALWEAMNLPENALMYSSFGSKNKVYHREDINTFLQKRKRNG